MKSQRRLALVWGRKFFFSYGLLSLMGLGLVFFQHMARPDSAMTWIYLVTTFIGHFGLMIAASFFVLYVPLIYISAGYYWSRFWASTILTSIVGFVALDAIVVGQYRWHFYELLRFKNNLSLDDILGASGVQSVFFGALVVFWVFLFVIGEKLWRHLQRRFSQTVSNWYLYPIVGCFLISNLIHIIADHKGDLELVSYDNILSFQVNPTAKKLFTKIGIEKSENQITGNQYHSFFYPKDQLKCESKPSKNLVVILVPSWGSSQFTEEENEVLHHYASHGQRFDQNYVGTNKINEGLFSFFYGLPSFYMNAFIQEKTKSVFLSTLSESAVSTSILSVNQQSDFLKDQADYESFVDNAGLVLAFKQKIESYDEATPFAIFNIIDHKDGPALSETIKSIMEELVAKKKVKTTNIVVASVSSSDSTGPLFTLFPNREDRVVTHFTQLVDIAPSLMKDQFKCKNNFIDYSLGQNLWETQKKNIVYAGLKENLSILSFDAEKKILVELEKQDYLKELKVLTLFHKRSR